MQIRTRITLYFIALTASLLLFSFFLIYSISKKERKSEFVEQLKNKSITTADLLLKISDVDSLLLKVIDKNKKDVYDFENISIYDENKNEIYTNNDKIHFETIFKNINTVFLQIKLNNEINTELKSTIIVGQNYRFKGNNYFLLASARDTTGIKNLKQLKGNLVYIFICILSFIGIIGWIFSRQILKPINTVIDQVNYLKLKKLNTRLTVKNQNDEIAKLTDAFNKMLDRVEKTIKLQNSFISNASHEIINPLASITSQIEIALLSDRSTDNYKKTLRLVLQDINRLNQISEQLIKLSKYSDSQEKIGFNNLRIDELLWETKNSYLIKNPDAKIQLSIGNIPDNEQSLVFKVNDVLLKTCFNNLLDNAIKFSTDKGVKLNLFVNDDFEIVISFENNGAGIDENEFENLFTPFFRSSNSKNINGYGIGLAIVKSILDLHQFEITVESIPNNKTVFTIYFKQSSF
ncbi:MAG: HAMP domain-containing histidine kinase [Fluviicola sp.]|nr:HAMP domain-containing histidine kinase [Fluviicola sp.]